MKKELVCIQCPVGCRMTAQEEDGTWQIAGNACKRGAAYALEECTAPRRIVTCLVRVEGAAQPLSVKTDGGVPKAQMFACINAIKELKLRVPVEIGQVLIPDVLGTGVAVIATKSV